MTGAELIAKERTRQIEKEGYNKEHDESHESDELIYAAVAYAIPHFWHSYPSGRSRETEFWPWDFTYWKPSPDDRVKELIKAGALIAAEIDRITDGTT